MAQIQTTDAQGLFTKAVTAAYKERNTPTGFIRSLFTEKVVPTLEVSIFVQRAKEKTATEVVRGTDGNRNEFSKSSEKIFVPQYFREFFDMTKLQLYNALFNAPSISSELFAAFVESVTDNIMDCQAKIERSIEKMGSDVLLSGKIFNKDGSEYIDFGRKAASFKDAGAGQYWANNIDPFNQLQDDCDFMRKVGKVSGGTFKLILGGTALKDFLANTKVTARQNLFNMNLDQIVGPVRDAVGSVFHGTITVGPYRIELWSYPQYFDAADGTSTSYIDEKKVILLPQNPNLQTVYAAVPQLLENGQAPQVGKFIFGDYIEKRSKSRVLDVESAPICIPIALDQIVTRTVAA